MAIQTERKMTVAEYLEWEERQEVKHEYIDGEIIEMTGGTANILVINGQHIAQSFIAQIDHVGNCVVCTVARCA